MTRLGIALAAIALNACVVAGYNDPEQRATCERVNAGRPDCAAETWACTKSALKVGAWKDLPVHVMEINGSLCSKLTPDPKAADDYDRYCCGKAL